MGIVRSPVDSAGGWGANTTTRASTQAIAWARAEPGTLTGAGVSRHDQRRERLPIPWPIAAGTASISPSRFRLALVDVGGDSSQHCRPRARLLLPGDGEVCLDRPGGGAVAAASKTSQRRAMMRRNGKGRLENAVLNEIGRGASGCGGRASEVPFRNLPKVAGRRPMLLAAATWMGLGCGGNDWSRLERQRREQFSHEGDCFTELHRSCTAINSHLSAKKKPVVTRCYDGLY